MKSKVTKNRIHFIEDYCDSREVFFDKISNFIGDQINIEPSIIYKGFELREEESCTAIGEGFAIPHAILSEASESYVFLHIIDKGVDYGAYDNQLVTVAFGLIIAEKNYNEKHLRQISSIARSLMDDETQRILKTERDVDKLVVLINGMGDNL